jgi:hypothetical protein
VGAAALLLVVCQALCPPSYAQQQQQSREREALRRAQAATQKAEQEKAQMQEVNAKLEKDKQDLAAKLKTSEQLKGKLSAAQKRETEQARELEQVRQEVGAAKVKISDLEGKLKIATGQFMESQEQNRNLSTLAKAYEERLGQQREIIGRQSQSLQLLDEKNLKLYQLNVELMNKYNKKSAWDAMMQREPFTQIKDVQIQSLLQEYRDKNDALKNEKPEIKQ